MPALAGGHEGTELLLALDMRVRAKRDMRAGYPRAVPADDPSLRVRPANREDILSLVVIHNFSVDEEEVAGFGTSRSRQPFANPRRLSHAWKDPNGVDAEEVVVAELDGRVAGYVTLEDRGREVELVDINVARDHQGRGIGRRLVRSVEDRARAEGKEAVTLGTSRNAAGVPWRSFPWWRARGYHVTLEEENAWTRSIGPGVREIRMRKEVRPVTHIELRDVDDGDLPSLFEQHKDPIANWMAAFTAKDPSDRSDFLAHWARILQDDSVTMQTVVFDGRVVGHVGSFFDRDFGKPEVTYRIDRPYWGRGLATLALREFLRRVTTRPIYARVAADNVASIRVLEKCGFVPTGHSRGFANARHAEIDEVVLKLEAMAASGPTRLPPNPR